MNMTERNLKYQPQPQHRRKTPSFSSSLLDSILRSIDESNDENDREHDHDHDIRFFASEPKRSTKIYFPQTRHTINGDEQMPSLRGAIMIDQWMETHNNNHHNHNGYVSSKSSRKFSSDSSSSGTTSSGTETPSTYRSLPNSFTISRKTAEVDFRDDTHHQQVNSINKREMKFMKSTRLKAMKIYGDLKKVKQPMSPGSRISTFLYSLFASSKKAKMEETMRSLKKSRSIKQDSTTTTCTSFSRSCMSKKQRNSSVKRSVRFYPENDTVILDRKSIHERDPNLPKYERRWLQEKKYMKNYKSFMVNVEDGEDEDEDEDEDDLFELQIVGGLGNHVAYGQELPVFETTDLRKIRI